MKNKTKEFVTAYSNVIASVCWGLATFVSDNWGLFLTIEIVLFLFLVLSKRKFLFDIGDVLLGLGMFFFYYFWGWDVWTAITLCIEILLVYQIGKMISFHDNLGISNSTSICVYWIAELFFLRGVLNYLKALINPGLVQNESWPMIGNNFPIPRTQQEFFFVIIVSLLPVFLITKEFGKIQKFIGILSGLIGIVLAICFEGRIAMMACIISAFILFFMQSILLRKKRLLATTFGVFLCVIIVLVLYENDVIHARTYFGYMMLHGSGGILHNTRFSLWRQGLSLLKEYPFGQSHAELIEYNGVLTSYAHNSWIDISMTSGAIPFVLILLFTLFIVYVALRCFCSRNRDNRCVIFAFLAVTLYNMIEPAILANRIFWLSEIIFSGILIGTYKANIK